MKKKSIYSAKTGPVGKYSKDEIGRGRDLVINMAIYGENAQLNNDMPGLIACPYCGYDFVHFGKPIHTKSDDWGEAWVYRGDCLEIPMYCEQGHEFDLCLGFHKGNTSMFVIRRPDREE